jgi:glycosyltransferase involved in cell wall biosynthesis
VGSYTKLIALSSYTEEWIRRIWKCDSEIIHPPVKNRVPSSTGANADTSPLIATVGRFFDPKFGHSKKQMEMLTAFADMAGSRDGVGDWRLAFIGGVDAASRDYVMRIRRAAQNLPIDVHVNASGEVVEATLARAQIYWHAGGYGEDEQRHPERFEHFGISVVEAMAAGAVPLVFGAGGPAEIVRDGIDGFHWHTLEQLARVTRRLMNDEDLRREMSTSARARARDFEPSVFDEKLLALIGSLKPTPQIR